MELYSEVDITGEKNTMFFLSSNVLDNPLPKIPDAIRRSVKQQQRPQRRMVLGPGNSSSGVGTLSISLPVRRIRCLKAKKKKERVNQGTSGRVYPVSRTCTLTVFTVFSRDSWEL